MATYDARPSAFTQLTATNEWEYLFSAMGIRDGVDNVASMNPSLDTVGRNIVMDPGNSVIKGQLWRCDAQVFTPIPAASAQDRIDRLALRLNRGATTSATVVQPVVVTGTPSGSPTKPPLTQTTTGIWDLPIASWTSAASGALTNLLDERSIAGQQRDPWHDMRPLINSWVGSNSGFNPPQYRFDTDYQHVEVAGWIKNPSSGVWNSKPFFVLPVGFRPSNTNGERWAATGVPVQDLAGNNYPPMVQAYGNGNMTIELGPASYAANTMIGINGRFALQGNGFFTS